MDGVHGHTARLARRLLGGRSWSRARRAESATLRSWPAWPTATGCFSSSGIDRLLDPGRRPQARKTRCDAGSGRRTIPRVAGLRGYDEEEVRRRFAEWPLRLRDPSDSVIRIELAAHWMHGGARSAIPDVDRVPAADRRRAGTTTPDGARSFAEPRPRGGRDRLQPAARQGYTGYAAFGCPRSPPPAHGGEAGYEAPCPGSWPTCSWRPLRLDFRNAGARAARLGGSRGFALAAHVCWRPRC